MVMREHELTIQTDRLTLRPWRPSDLDPFAALCADPEVMRYFPRTLTRAECQAYIENANQRFDRQGYSRWAVEAADAPCIGFVGLAETNFDAFFTPAIEIGWRLAKEHWGRGYAPEAAKAVLRFAFQTLHQSEVTSFAPLVNTPSLSVMQKIGMRRDARGDFDHPVLSDFPVLQRCALYRLTRDQWNNR